SDRLDSVLGRQRHRVTITSGQQFILALFSIAPDRTNRVNDPRSRETVTLGYLCLPCGTTSQPAALRQKFRTGGATDSAIHATTAQQRGVGGVDDGVHPLPCDVPFHDLDAGGFTLIAHAIRGLCTRSPNSEQERSLQAVTARGEDGSSARTWFTVGSPF